MNKEKIMSIMSKASSAVAKFQADHPDDDAVRYFAENLQTMHQFIIDSNLEAEYSEYLAELMADIQSEIDKNGKDV